jgi:hypothetical protein
MEVTMGDVEEATEGSLTAAMHLTDMDQGAVEVLRRMARLIDAQSDGGLTPDGKLDNVSIPTYLKYCESLGLTPAGRLKLGTKKEAPSGRLGDLRAIPRPNRSA